MRLLEQSQVFIVLSAGGIPIIISAIFFAHDQTALGFLFLVVGVGLAVFAIVIVVLAFLIYLLIRRWRC
jgi:hypothetical protein